LQNPNKISGDNLQNLRRETRRTFRNKKREIAIAIGKLKSYKSPGTDQIPAEFIKAGGETLCSEIHKLIGTQDRTRI
jgi:hypothetical protein